MEDLSKVEDETKLETLSMAESTIRTEDLGKPPEWWLNADTDHGWALFYRLNKEWVDTCSDEVVACIQALVWDRDCCLTYGLSLNETLQHVKMILNTVRTLSDIRNPIAALGSETEASVEH